MNICLLDVYEQIISNVLLSFCERYYCSKISDCESSSISRISNYSPCRVNSRIAINIQFVVYIHMLISAEHRSIHYPIIPSNY